MAKHDIVADRIQSHTTRVIAETPIQQRDSRDWNDYAAKDYVTKEAVINGFGEPLSPMEVEYPAGDPSPLVIDMTGVSYGLRPSVTVSLSIDPTQEEIIYDARVKYIFTDLTKTSLSAILIAGHEDSGNNLDTMYITIKR